MDEPGLLPLLTVVTGSMRGASFRLLPGSRVIGRTGTADIVIEDIQISRRHAAVRLAGGQVSLADMGSTNGTWLNGERMLGVARLADGDRIRLGGVELRFFDLATAETVPVHGFRAITPLAPAASVPGALSAPTQAVTTPTNPARLVTAMSAGLAMIGGLASGYLFRRQAGHARQG